MSCMPAGLQRRSVPETSVPDATRQIAKVYEDPIVALRQSVAEKKAHAVESRARTVNREYRRKLHKVDKIAGTRCAAPRTQSGHC